MVRPQLGHSEICVGVSVAFPWSQETFPVFPVAYASKNILLVVIVILIFSRVWNFQNPQWIPYCMDFPNFGPLNPSSKEFIEDFAEIHPVRNSLMILEIMTMVAKNIFLGLLPTRKSQGRSPVSRGTQRNHPHRFLVGTLANKGWHACQQNFD